MYLTLNQKKLKVPSTVHLSADENLIEPSKSKNRLDQACVPDVLLKHLDGVAVLSWHDLCSTVKYCRDFYTFGFRG